MVKVLRLDTLFAKTKFAFEIGVFVCENAKTQSTQHRPHYEIQLHFTKVVFAFVNDNFN